MKDKIVFEQTRRVEFADTDMAGIVHFTNILRYMEETEYAFLRSKGLCVSMRDDRGRYGFPRVNVQCDYMRPIRFEDVLLVKLTVERNDGKQLVYSFDAVCDDSPVAKGRFTVACCRFPGDGDPFAIPIPDEILDQIPLTDNE